MLRFSSHILPIDIVVSTDYDMLTRIVYLKRIVRSTGWAKEALKQQINILIRN